MSYGYGYNGSSGRYGGSYGGGMGGGYGGGYGGGGFQDYDRNRNVPYGGDGAYGVYSGDRDYDRGYGSGGSGSYGGYGSGSGGGRVTSYQTDTYTSGQRGGGYGMGGGYGGVSGVGGYHSSGIRDYEREQRSSRKYRTGGAGVSFGGGSKSRQYRDTDRSSAYTKYRNNRDTSTSTDTSTDDDDNREGFMGRMADKVKGVFGYGPEGQRNTNDNDYNNNSYGGNYTSSSRRNKDYDSSRYTSGNKYNTSSSNKYNTGSYGGGYGSGYGANNIVSLRSRREVQPSMNEESGSKSLLWQINAQGFDLDNIRVADAGNNKLEISGHAEDVGQNYRRTKQFTRIITLPEGCDAKQVKSRISGNGLLTITVPYTGQGLHTIGTRELQIGQGSTMGALTSGRTGTTGSSGTTGGSSSYGSGSGTTGTSGGQYQQHTTTSTTRSSTNA